MNSALPLTRERAQMRVELTGKPHIAWNRDSKGYQVQLAAYTLYKGRSVPILVAERDRKAKQFVQTAQLAPELEALKLASDAEFFMQLRGAF